MMLTGQQPGWVSTEGQQLQLLGIDRSQQLQQQQQRVDSSCSSSRTEGYMAGGGEQWFLTCGS
jgi:hypothetical protein